MYHVFFAKIITGGSEGKNFKYVIQLNMYRTG